jgi:hypothetical protein
MKSAFLIGEVVRVRRMHGWADGTRNVVGYEGRVETFHPRADVFTGSPGWEVCIWLFALEEIWCFNEDELITTGRVELVDDLGTRVVPRAEAGAATDPPPVTGRFFVEPGTRPDNLAASIRRRLSDCGDLARLSLKTSRAQDRDSDVIEISVWPEGDASLYFEQLVEGGNDPGWIRKYDDGWSCDFWWSRQSSNAGRFLVDGVQEAAVSLTPWNDPRRRQVPIDRTSDPGLPVE